MPKQMRKGTRSCLECRRRKVRCSFASSESKLCVNCARRKVACVPQGEIEVPTGSGPLDIFLHEEHDEAPESHFQSFFSSLHHLRDWVELPTSSSLSNSSYDLGQATTELDELFEGPEFVRNNHAPVMKLFNDHRMGRLINYASKVNPRHSDDIRQNTKHAHSIKTTLSEMLSVFPSEEETKNIFQHRGKWWETWRESFGLGWGESRDKTLDSFATRAVCARNPSLIGSLLVCFALSTGEFKRYLHPVEIWILAEETFTGHVYDFQCMLALGLCLLSAVQPSRAWSVFRTANTRLQLAGIHRSHGKSESLDAVFWQIFAADRWISLMIGLPYSVPDHLCDLHIPDVTESSYISFHYRHLTILTGHVLDTLQSNTSVSLSQLIAVEGKIDVATAHLPPSYLDMPEILACSNGPNKSARLYRLAHIHQLKTFLYLPLFLQNRETKDEKLDQRHQVQYGKTACTKSARSFLTAFLALFDLDPQTASVDNSMKLSAFTALSAAVILYLNHISAKKESPTRRGQELELTEPDMTLIRRTILVLHICTENQEGSLCYQCHNALLQLVSCGGNLDKGESRQIPVPYFGIVTLIRGRENGCLNGFQTQNEDARTEELLSHSQSDPSATTFPFEDIGAPMPIVSGEMFFSYDGPWEIQDTQSPLLYQNADHDLYQLTPEDFDTIF